MARKFIPYPHLVDPRLPRDTKGQLEPDPNAKDWLDQYWWYPGRRNLLPGEEARLQHIRGKTPEYDIDVIIIGREFKDYRESGRTVFEYSGNTITGFQVRAFKEWSWATYRKRLAKKKVLGRIFPDSWNPNIDHDDERMPPFHVVCDKIAFFIAHALRIDE